MSAKVNKDDLKQEEKLIAVMLLEAYNENFRPFSLKRAQCLVPLVGGKTQLDRNIEYLIANRVEEIYLFCTTHSSQIKAHLNEERLKSWRSQGCEVHFLYNYKCQSVGDAMREIDAKGLVRSNFILVTASAIISHIKLSEYLETHKTVSKLDKNCVMTMLCQDRSNDLTYNSSLNEMSFASQPNTLIIHNNNNKILHYDKVKSQSSLTDRKASKYINLPVELFQDAYRSSAKQVAMPASTKPSQAEILCDSDIGVQSTNGTKMSMIQHLKTIQQRHDLIESGIYLCSPYVLHMFTDNFDYENMVDYVRGVLIEEEVAGYTCYIDILSKQFGSKRSHYSMISNVNTYYFEMMRLIKQIDLVLDVYERAAYTRLPDHTNVCINYSQTKIGSNVQFKRNCVVDAGCTIGNDCQLVNCYVGANCRLGNGVKLSNCIVWANTWIGDNSTLNGSLLGFNVRIGNDCSVCENCLFASDCHVKNNSKLTERGVFVVRKELDKKDKKASSAGGSFSVSEDNYSKYFLNAIGVDDGEESDDDFGSVDGEEDYEDEESIQSERGDEDDTSKNNHFYVWKIRSNKVEAQQNRLRRNSEDSLASSNSCRSELSAESTDEFDQESDEDEDEYVGDASAGLAEGSKIADEDHETFMNETIEILKRGLKENLKADNLILEINSCKHANNIQIDDLCYFLSKAVLNLPIVMGQQDNYLGAFKEYVKKSLGDLLVNYYTKTKQSQKFFLDATLDFFVESPQDLVSSFVKLLHYLYNDLELLSEIVINEWYEDKLNKEEADSLNTLKRLQPFINWLQESDEDSDEEDEDDE